MKVIGMFLVDISKNLGDYLKQLIRNYFPYPAESKKSSSDEFVLH
jgi:hypothetical protein